MMKQKLLVFTLLASSFSFAQLAVPSGQVQATTNASTGNVGIGTNNPQAKFDIVFGGEPKTIKFLESSNAVNSMNSMLRFTWYNDTADLGIVRSGSEPIEAMAIRFNQNEVARFTPNGNVGIGIKNPLYNLDVQGTFRVGNAGRFTFNGAADLWLEYPNRGSGGRAMVHDGGNVLTLNYANDFTGGTRLGTSFLVKDDNASLQGKLEAKEVKVTLTPTADFVFDENYNLPKLEDVEKHIKERKHLPEIASAKVMEKEGVNVGEFQIKLLQKIEELTLYSIEQSKQIKSQSEQLRQIQEENKTLRSQSKEIGELKKQVQQLLTLKK